MRSEVTTHDTSSSRVLDLTRDLRTFASSNGGDHVVPAFVSPSVSIPVLDGEPALGTWQSLVLVDTNVDNPQRKVRWSFLPAVSA